MRSQATKPLPKKGALSKTSFKTSSSPKQSKRKSVTPKKIKNLTNKSLPKSPKKSLPKDSKDEANNKNEGETSANDKSGSMSETSKIVSSKSNTPRSDSPSKKSKKEPKKKEDAVKNSPDAKKVVKKSIKLTKKAKTIKPNVKDSEAENDDVKYKINIDVIKKNTSKFSKAKTLIKKGSVIKKKNITQSSLKQDVQEEENEENIKQPEKDDKTDIEEDKKLADIKFGASQTKDEKTDTKLDEKCEIKDVVDSSARQSLSPNVTSPNLTEIPKTEVERPPKFFTSSRSPRTVDIDVKCFKNSKGNISVSERFLSMKFETKTEDSNKEKNTPNTLVSQGSEIDVYTFTEKVDSPKSILSDFRSPLNKNIGRVRPIARVKGTIIDKKTDAEKKKYSPHRPIEEVVKQLKANKRSEELNTGQATFASNLDSNIISNEKDLEDAPKAIVSKSYKMVARKSSITGKPFSPTKFLEQEPSPSKTEKSTKTANATKKFPVKTKKQQKKNSLSDEEIDSSKFALNTKSLHYTSSEESVNESNDDNDTKESSESDTPKIKKTKSKKYKKTAESTKKTSKELKELSKDSGTEFNEQLFGEKPSKRRLKLLSMWAGPKKHRMASLNAIAKVHCLYENESRTHMELGLMRTIDRQIVPSTSKPVITKKKEAKPKETEKQESTSESEYENKLEKKEESSESSDDNPPQRSLRGVPGIRSAGKYWDPKSSTSSSEDSEMETKKKVTHVEKKKTTLKSSPNKSDTDKPPAKMKKTAGVPVKKKRNRNEVVMDLKDMVVQKRMASLNATAILAASYEKRSPKSNKEDTTSDSCSDESFSQKPKNGVGSGVKSETKTEETKKENEDSAMTDRKQKVEVIVNQDTDVTITGVYSTHHEGFCTAMQYRISSTSHTQTTATANCEKVRIQLKFQFNSDT